MANARRRPVDTGWGPYRLCPFVPRQANLSVVNRAGSRLLPHLGLPAARDLGRIGVLYLVSRLAVLAAFGVAMIVRQGITFRELVAPWDVGWYLHIATNGYPSDIPMQDGRVAQNATAFFPLFPVLVRWVDRLTPLDGLQSAVAIAVVGGFVSVVLLWMLVREVVDAETADRSAALFGFFPASFVFLIGYSEAVMLPFAIGCLIALRRRAWVSAGLMAGIATFARPNAVALCLACAWAAFGAMRTRRDWKALLAPLLSPAGLVVFTAFLWARTGDPLVSLNTQRDGWGQRLDFGAKTIESSLSVLDRPIDVNVVVSTLSVLFVIAGLVLMIRWRPPAEIVIYTLVVIAPVLMSSTISSRPRFALTAFPLLVAYARAARETWWSAVLGASGVLLGALTLLTITTMAATP